MKILFLLFCVLPFFAFSQKSKLEVTNPDRLGGKNFKFEVYRIAPGEIKLPFSSIKIIDNRFDTSKLGFVPIVQFIGNKNTEGRKIVFSDGVGKSIENYYKEFYQNAFSSNGVQLIIVMKKFWLSGIDNERNREIDIPENVTSNKYLYCKWEYYLAKGDEFMPVKRIDTVINGVVFESKKDQYIHNKTTDKILKLLLNGLIEVFDFNAAVNQIEKLPKKTWQQIEAYNSAMFNIPVLKDSVFAKGVYLSFNEFKNNKPSIINFKESKMRIAINKTENYLEDDKGNRITNYWGYFTGEELKIGKYGNDKLYRVNNTFEFFLKHQYLTVNTNIIGGATHREVWIPYQVDMESGAVY
jgi:hypothetical protein